MPAASLELPELLAGAVLLVCAGAEVLEAAPPAEVVTGVELEVVNGLDADAAAAVVDEELAVDDEFAAVGSRALKGTLSEFDELLPGITKIVSVSKEEIKCQPRYIFGFLLLQLTAFDT
jgi:hypothetical protein